MAALLPADAAQAVAAADGPHALKLFLDARGPVDMDHVLEVAANMLPDRRTALLKTLATWPTTVPLGW